MLTANDSKRTFSYPNLFTLPDPQKGSKAYAKGSNISLCVNPFSILLITAGNEKILLIPHTLFLTHS